MKTNLPKQAVLSENSAGLPNVTRRMIRERAVELALINGRSTQDVSKSDWEQAKQELSGKPDPDSNLPAHKSVAERERWDPMPGSTGHKVHVPSGDEEDDEGRSDTERLVERGVRDAGRDQMFEAAREAEENE